MEFIVLYIKRSGARRREVVNEWRLSKLCDEQLDGKLTIIRVEKL